MRVRSGYVLVYMAVSMFAFCGLASLAVDFAHVQTCKQELEMATDAAALYAAAGLKSSNNGTSGAIANATASFAENKVDGQAAPFNPATDITTGIWTPSTGIFVPATIAAGANAVKLTTTFTLGSAGHALSLLTLITKTISIHATSIAMVNGQDASTFVSASGNPWLSGMASGTVCTDFCTDSADYDTAGASANSADSPAAVSLSTIHVTSGTSIIFDDVTGSSNYAGSTSTITNADGDATQLCNLGSPTFGSYSYFTSPMNGMSNCHAPVDAMIAVFLSDADPSTTAAPSPLDFSTDAERNFTSLSPALKQVFFVGDGRCDDGQVQQFTVPAGATRLFIANMDGWQYNNNVGGYNLTVHATQSVTIVYTH